MVLVTFVSGRVTKVDSYRIPSTSMYNILEKANRGINMNLLAFCTPDRTSYYSDLCPAGLGGDTAIKARHGTFRFQLISNFKQPTAYSRTSRPSSPHGLSGESKDGCKNQTSMKAKNPFKPQSAQTRLATMLIHSWMQK